MISVYYDHYVASLMKTMVEKYDGGGTWVVSSAFVHNMQRILGQQYIIDTSLPLLAYMMHFAALDDDSRMPANKRPRQEEETDASSSAGQQGREDPTTRDCYCDTESLVSSSAKLNSNRNSEDKESHQFDQARMLSVLLQISL